MKAIRKDINKNTKKKKKKKSGNTLRELVDSGFFIKNLLAYHTIVHCLILILNYIVSGFCFNSLHSK